MHLDLSVVTRRFINWQIAISERFDNWLPQSCRINGETHFQNVIAPPHIIKGITICDVGGGKRPYVTAEMKSTFALKTIGVDIDQRELDSAPCGTYTATICDDISTFRGNHDVDLVICQSVLEHVPKVDLALQSIASMLKPSGVALIFLPCRNALFARLNLVFPEKLKQWLLFTIFPGSSSICGFRSYYNQCTPNRIARLASQNGFLIQEVHAYFYSYYFTFFFPFHLIWRVWSLLSRAVLGNAAAESFTIIVKRPGDADRHSCEMSSEFVKKMAVARSMASPPPQYVQAGWL